MNNAGIDFAQGFVVYSERHLGLFPQIGEKHICLFDQAMEYFSALLVLDVQPDPFLVAVGKLEGKSLPIRRGEADPADFLPAPHGISFCLLNFDHLSAEIPEDSTGSRPGMKRSEFHNTNPFQGHWVVHPFIGLRPINIQHSPVTNPVQLHPSPITVCT